MQEKFQKPKVLVIGSSNTDLVIRMNRLPLPGETVLGNSFMQHNGGKGGNQAVAAARLGASVDFVTKVGKDLFGQEAILSFSREGINIAHIRQDASLSSGVALIMVNEQGENSIAVAQGANASLLPGDLTDLDQLIGRNNIVLLQLEIPMETVVFVSKRARQLGKTVILNPAPACQLPEELLTLVTVLTPNETEAGIISGIPVVDAATAKRAAARIVEMGAGKVVLTKGANGSLVHSGNEVVEVPAIPVQAVDTTAAGDIFNGALAVALAEGKSLPEAAVFASKAAGIAVTREGAQTSAPRRVELEYVNLSTQIK